MVKTTCLPGGGPGWPETGCGHARAGGRYRPRSVLVLVVVLVAATVPLALITAGMTPAAALSTAGAVTAFAFGVTHQVLHLLAGFGRRGAAAPVNA
jgi:fatty acid desaturase